jgi:D-beta-D-heptose 7-phosphate kinase / D-beta-D-heptose 1-phosphate adenosyltransferase
MKLTMPGFSQARILVVGDVMLDRYWHGGTSRISPEAPVPIVKVEQSEDRPGGAGNVALNITALGAAASLVGITGKDEAAESLEASLTAVGVNCDFSQSPDQPTITKLRVISRHQQLLRMDFEEAFGMECSVAIQNKVSESIGDHGAMVLSDYAKGVLHDPQPMIKAANAANIPVLVDPKGSDFERYRGATLLTPNLSEFEAVVGPCEHEQDLVDKGEVLMERLDLQALLITRGEHGMTLLRPGKEEFHLPARAREVFDVTGAGDTVISVVAAALAAGEALPQAVALANIAASIVVGKLGTAAISAPELRRAVQIDQGSERGVVSREQLMMALADAREHGEKVIMTNGCFDIIHAGHVSYLEKARELGDRLIVAINNDDSVRRLKGAGRPINPEDRRMAVLAGLESVDWVVSFDEDTPENLLHDLKPDMLVKGGDYDYKGVVGWAIVESYGGEVKVLNFVDDLSTSAIVEQIKNEG